MVGEERLHSDARVRCDSGTCVWYRLGWVFHVLDGFAVLSHLVAMLCGLEIEAATFCLLFCTDWRTRHRAILKKKGGTVDCVGVALLTSVPHFDIWRGSIMKGTGICLGC